MPGISLYISIKWTGLYVISAGMFITNFRGSTEYIYFIAVSNTFNKARQGQMLHVNDCVYKELHAIIFRSENKAIHA